MIIQRDPYTQEYFIADSNSCDAHFLHYCKDLTGKGRIPLPVALIEESEAGIESRAWMREFLPKLTPNQVEYFWSKQCSPFPNDVN